MILLHGDDETSSRKRLNLLMEQAKKEGSEIHLLEGKDINLTDLSQIVNSTGFFNTTRTIVILELFSLSVSANKTKILDFLKKNVKENIIVWEGSSVNGQTLKSFSGLKSEIFKTPVKIFNFVEQIRPNNQTTILKLYAEILDTGAAAEYLFIMIIRQIRLLIIYKSTPTSSSLNSWTIKNLLPQAKLFTLDELLHLHHRLYDIDKSIKTGTSPIPLYDHLLSFFLEL